MWIEHTLTGGSNGSRPPRIAAAPGAEPTAQPTAEPGPARLVSRPRVFSGADAHGALAALAAGRESNQGPARLVVLAADPDQAAARAAAARDWLLGDAKQPEGVWFRATPLAGEVGFVFSGGSMAYPGMGRGLRSAFPALLGSVEARCGSLNGVAGGGTDRNGPGHHVVDQIVGAALLSSVHTRITGDLLRIAPQAVIGYSSGEFSACVAMAWPDPAQLIEQVRSSDLFTRGLTRQHDVVRRAWRRAGIDGDWASYNVMSTAAEVRAALAGEPAVHLMVVNEPRSCVIGGEAKGCQRVLDRLRAHATPVDYDVTVHIPEIAGVREQLRQLFHRPVQPTPGVRFYGCAADDPYFPTPETVADALAGMVVQTVDFPRLVQRAWDDGVRVFIEHGPHRVCSKWIERILGDREHLTVCLDVPDEQGIPQLSRAVAHLLAAGVPVATDRLYDHLDEAMAPAPFRLPQPPLLLIDRVTGIDTTPASAGKGAGKGTIWSQTDVRPDQWYLDAAGRMPAGIIAEGGQSLLLLLRQLDLDLPNADERKCRFLGAELTYHGSPPVPGETLSYEIHADGFSEHDGICLVFFHADCQVDGQRRLTVSNGQAGLFTADHLISSPGLVSYPKDAPDMVLVDPPAIDCARHTFDPAAVRAFADGRPYDCFGTGWEATRAHLRTPRIAGRAPVSGEWCQNTIRHSRPLLHLHEVTRFAPQGGPWGRGYLRAEQPITPDAWFFASHLPDDPCMPATLMFDGCLQAMSFYLAAMGYTADRDGWRFEPVPDNTLRMRCRGQVTPASRQLTYEVFVAGVFAGPRPTLFADVLCSVDGVPALHARHVGLHLVPDWPLEQWRRLPAAQRQATGEPAAGGQASGEPAALALAAAESQGDGESARVAVVDGFRFGYASLLAWAWGRPSEAFGPAYARFDGTHRLPRMPGPPFHFISRIMAVDRTQGGQGSRVETEYDVPPQAWYWQHNGSAVMPLAVLMEVALQPCGWLATYVGSALGSDNDLLFRNLDGQGIVTAEVAPGIRTLRTRVVSTTVAKNDGVTIESFDVQCYAGSTLVFSLSTTFGTFPAQALDHQVGLPASAAERARLTEASEYLVDLTTRPARYCQGPLRLAGPMLLMLDRVTGYWPDGGRAGLGRLRAEKDVDPGEWFFRAHFFQDPVQPGSLGVEAMVQLLQYYMIERDLGAGLPRPRFEPVRLGERLSWKYRGQVVPTSTRITIEMEILDVGTDDRGRHAVAEAWLWVDGVRIYHAERLGMRIVPDEPSRALEQP